MKNKSNNAKYQQLTDTMDSFLYDAKIPVIGYSASLIENGRITFERSGGYRHYDANADKCLPMNRDTRYRIASISKMFTSIAIMQQVESGKMSLDGDASEYLGFELRNPHFPNIAITPRLLMAHYGSVRDGSAYSIPKSVSISECFLPGGSYYRDGEHFASPDGIHNMAPGGGYYVYSNLNYGLLGTIVERLSAERFDKYVRKHILLPMGISASFNLGDFNKEQIENLAAIYKPIKDGSWTVEGEWTAQADDYKGEIQSPDNVIISNPDLGIADYTESIADYVIGTNGTVFSPQGGLRISAHELALLGEMFLGLGMASNGNRILRPESIEELFKPVWVYSKELDNRDLNDSSCAYGAGINIVSAALGGDYLAQGMDDITMYGHTGSAYGLLSACYVDPVNNVGFAYAFNGTGADHEMNKGLYSRRTIWHERMMSAICATIYNR